MMGTKALVACAVLTLAVVVTASRADDGPDAELAKLRAKVKELQDENQTLKAEVVRLKEKLDPKPKVDEARLKADLSRLQVLSDALLAKPKDELLQKEAAALAMRLAPDLPGNGLIYDVLIKTEVLKDGISLAEATKLLGPPTEKKGSLLIWYYNPKGLHVAPQLYATETKEGVVKWGLNLR